MKSQIHVVVFFINIGFYHLARLRAAEIACSREGWKLTAVQLTDDNLEHPWGSTNNDIGFPLVTLISKEDKVDIIDGLPKVSNYDVNNNILSLKPDVIFIPGWSFNLSKKLLRSSRKKNIPAVVMSESKFDDLPRSWWKELIKSYLYVKKFSAAIVGSDAHADYVNSLGMPSQSIFKGYDAVDNEHFKITADYARNNEQEVRAKYHNIPERPYFIVVTRLMPRKNILRLIEAYNNYRKKSEQEPWDLVICGNGEEKNVIERSISNYELHNFIHLVGFIAYEEVGHWYGLASAFVHPALKEQWGLVVNEACASGLPILCSQTVGSCNDLVLNEENGYIFNPTSATEIVRCLLKVHEIGQNGRDKMGRISQSLVELCGPEKFGLGLISATKTACNIEN